ncbi:CatB-related O-acetyltransferase [Cellulophaga sp. HaHaR_3_176]|uniref:acyltransferase n=1 Tax=Cellulophaga sp. HaHaR_3_176 TaxID=1942464 RepID=UPI001C1F3863|nr:CatB-related O-acetyltransferase [Cellulophaga sp. HaHaR_3_176]QWX84795.1 CatB-related O-acetyltransferase [Cellulophaga sp. HaHaR_3_176]
MKNIYFFIKHLLRLPLDFIKKNNIHNTTRISSNTLISKTKIGRGNYIANNTVLINTELGNYCSIAPGVQIGGMQHSYWWLSTSPRLSDQCIFDKKTIIGNDVWIAAGCIIKQGVTIGDGAVIGAMSFVNQDIPENSIYFGSPAKFYKKRLDDTTFERLKKTEYWNYDYKKAKEILTKFDSK